MMPESLMDEQEAAPSHPNEGGGEEEHNQEGPSALINAEVCPDCQVGDVLMLKVLKHHGEELEVSFMGKEGDEGGKPVGEPSAEPTMPKGESLME